MNNNPTIDNDLQKAIDDITRTTSSDPIFADPVADPVAAPVSNFSNEPKQDMQPISTPVAAPTMPETTTTSESTTAPELATPESEPVEEIVAANETISEATTTPFMEKTEDNLNVDQVKEAALRDLAPILNKLDLPPEHKFSIYKNVIENYHDTSVLGPAYRTAAEIKDDKERGEALLYIVESIDKM